MYRSPADRAACSVCGDVVRDDDGATDDLSGWRACELCWNRAVGRGEADDVSHKSMLALGVTAVAYALWQLVASSH